jgi:DNA-binding PadR family transcriptional regulator
MLVVSEPTTTTFAILGLLALRPYSAYELAQRMELSLRFYWPRAQSKIYEEPKKLVDLGWATSTEESTGKRSRTRYRITAAGKKALVRWLQDPGAAPLLEHEAVLKVALSDRGTLEGLRANLHAILHDAAETLAFGDDLAEEFLSGAETFSERLHVGALVWSYLSGFAEQRARWAAWALARTEEWKDIEGDEARLNGAKQSIARWLERSGCPWRRTHPLPLDHDERVKWHELHASKCGCTTLPK